MRRVLANLSSPLSLVVPLAGLLIACGDNGEVNRPVDASPSDSATTDVAVIDATQTDATSPDAAQIDATQTDAAQIDAAMIDAAQTDAAQTDAAQLDAAQIDAAQIDAGTPIDAATPIDASTVDALPPLAPHLLITEIKTVDADEFIEIYNPTDQTISLRNYYLADVGNYFLLPGVVAGNTTVTTDATDFLVRFPVGATIAPRQVITVATDAVQFETLNTLVPTYAVQELGNSIATEVVWSGSGTTNPGLTNAGEIVVLFFWDGVSDNVKDVDIILAGNAPTAANGLVTKTAVDGPDADTTTTPYATDVPSVPFDMQTDTATGTTYKRIAFEGASETHTGGNGILGDDETSEVVRTTWDSQAMASGYTAGTPGVIPVALQ